ncbi:MAG TPA: ATP-dependent zinc metalloprotease FtsH [Candidatus Portnoybacteria bacterium]|nr:ATP-dependent zinc metalloprotease FtsH [Candidatus Portnoybacteria bacterium]MDD5752247.1 ATP-dependent zinc metalloprotease FtsH [Candidatus Portnoybacteria bacterium]HNU96746.1 ATP-dependent zinc metalloprotease FtsH [Candidatus Portnoybacteria bacterium]HOZ16528.1 ATP-dependent zinc metalloprotease FtsH [Candidatus Portnoybacteria bacterium]HPH52287.1 ATP-dependent zinc metalloprotease FtsH [Candidatus Portnoybacteria bacterium]
MKTFIKNILIVFFVLLVISSVFTVYNSSYNSTEEIPLNQVVSLINEDKVEKITIQENKLEVLLKDETQKTSQKEGELGLSETLKNLGVNTDKLQKINFEIKEESGAIYWLNVILPFLLPFLLIAAFIWFMFKQAQKGQTQALSFGKANIKLNQPEKGKKVTFKDIAGIEQAKEELKEIVEFLKTPQKFIDIGAKIPRGVLLMGPPGCGKTLLARAVAGESDVPFFHISGSEFVEMFVGVGASRVRDLFMTAKKFAPAIVFIDEIDAVGRHRGAGLGGGHDEREQTLNQILVEMDGFDNNTNLIVVAATNRPDILDPALLRPGRFDRRVILDMPDINEREDILKIHSKNKKFTNDVNLRQLAERTPGFSGADLANLVNEAAILAARKNQKTINQLDLINSIEKVLLGPERKSHVLTKKEKEIAAYHEAGHALVNASLTHTDPVHKVSIISRGRAAGYTLKLPEQDKHLHSRSEFVEELSVLLGGYCAEKLIFNEITTGASNDLKVASGLAKDLVTKYGMSEKLGPIAFNDHEELVFLGKEISEGRNYSEKVAGEIDDEIKKFIRDARIVTEKILKTRKAKLTQIAKELITKETIEKDEFEKLMAK